MNHQGNMTPSKETNKIPMTAPEGRDLWTIWQRIENNPLEEIHWTIKGIHTSKWKWENNEWTKWEV